VGYSVKHKQHFWLPESGQSSLHMFEGPLPCSDILPYPFYADTSKKLEATIRTIKDKYSKKLTSSQKSVVKEWEAWESDPIVPKTSDVAAYIKANPLYIPFEKEMFGGDFSVSGATVAPILPNKMKKIWSKEAIKVLLLCFANLTFINTNNIFAQIKT